MKNKKDKKMNTFSICKYFYTEVFKQKPVYIVLLFLNIIQMALVPFINIFFPKFIIDELLGNKELGKIIIYVSIIIFGNGFFAAVGHILHENRLKYDDWFTRYFKLQISNKCMSMSFQYTESSKTMNLIEKVNTGMSWYSGGIEGLSNCIIAIISSTITLIGIIAIVFTISPFLILVSIIAVIVNAYVTAKMNAAQIEYFNNLPHLNKRYGYFFQKIMQKQYAKELRLYNGTDMMMDKALKTIIEILGYTKKLAKTNTKWSLHGTIVSVFSFMFAYGYLGIKAITKKITIGQFTMMISAIVVFSENCLNNIISSFQELNKKANFMSAYINFMDYQDLLETGEKGISEALNKVNTSDYLIEFKNVYFKYPEANEYTLENINIKLKGGEHLSVVGLNGTGKTTFIKLLCRLYDVTKGGIYLNGIDIREYKYTEYLKLISVVFQDYKLFSLSIKDNVTLGSDSCEVTRVKDICKISGIEELIKKLNNGLNTLLYKDFDDKGVEPSGGEAQKIAITRALYKDAPIVILDEPTAALDPVAEYEIYKKFNSLIGGKTAIYISHRLSSCKFCDTIAVFAEGTIKEYGTHDELIRLENGLYAEMFSAQSQYYA